MGNGFIVFLINLIIFAKLMTSVDSRIGGQNLVGDGTVTIYVRNYDKKAIILRLPIKVRLEHIKQKIARKMKIPEENQALFLHGIPVDSHQQIIVQNKQIFHLVNLKRTNLPSLTIYIKRIQQGSRRFQFTVNSDTKIHQFFEKQLCSAYDDPDKIFLVYTGRELKHSKTFGEEFIQHQSQILAIHKTENLKSQFIIQNTQNNGKRVEKILEQKIIQKKNEPEKKTILPQHQETKNDKKLREDRKKEIIITKSEQKMAQKHQQGNYKQLEGGKQEQANNEKVEMLGSNINSDIKEEHSFQDSLDEQRKQSTEKVQQIEAENIQILHKNNDSVNSMICNLQKDSAIAVSIKKTTALQIYEKKLKEEQKQHQKKENQLFMYYQTHPIEIVDLKKSEQPQMSENLISYDFNLFSPHSPPPKKINERVQESKQSKQIEFDLTYSQSAFSNDKKINKSPENSNQKSMKSGGQSLLLDSFQEGNDYKVFRRKIELSDIKDDIISMNLTSHLNEQSLGEQVLSKYSQFLNQISKNPKNDQQSMEEQLMKIAEQNGLQNEEINTSAIKQIVSKIIYEENSDNKNKQNEE